MKKLIAICAAAILVNSVLLVQGVYGACVGQNTDEFKPLYNCGTHTVIFKWDTRRGSDCFKELYFRMTPQEVTSGDGNNQLVLNKQTVKNNDAPDAGPSTDHGTQRWLFDGGKVGKLGSNTLRLYGTVVLVDESNGQTVTKYWHDFDIRQKTWDFSAAFGYFHLRASPELCLQ